MKKLYLGVVLASVAYCFAQNDTADRIQFNRKSALTTKNFKTLTIVEDYLQYLTQYMQIELTMRTIASLEQKNHLEASSSEIIKHIKLLEERILNDTEASDALNYYKVLESQYEEDYDKVAFAQDFLKNVQTICKKNFENLVNRITPREHDHIREFNRECKNNPNTYNFERAPISKK